MGTTPQTTASFNGLTCGTGYPVGVDAFDAAGNSSPPANMTVTTSPCADTQPPTAPTNVTASTRTTTSIALTWAPATDNVGVAGYGVYNGADLVDTTAGTTGIVSGLTCGTNYTLAVDAFDATGNSSPKTAIMVSTLPCTDTTPPSQPTNLRTTSATTTSVTLAWNASTDNVAVAGYDIYRASHQSRHRHHNHLHDQRTHLRNHLHRRRQSHRHRRQHLRPGDRPDHHLPCAHAPTSTGFPDASNTGVPAGTTLTAYTGPSNDHDAEHGDRRQDDRAASRSTRPASSFATQGCPVRVSGRLHVNSGSVTIEDSEIDCQGSNGTGIGSSNVTVRRSDISRCENGFDVDWPHHRRGFVDSRSRHRKRRTYGRYAVRPGCQQHHGAAQHDQPRIQWRHLVHHHVGRGQPAKLERTDREQPSVGLGHVIRDLYAEAGAADERTCDYQPSYARLRLQRRQRLARHRWLRQRERRNRAAGEPGLSPARRPAG